MEKKTDFSRFWLSQYSSPVPHPGSTACYRACQAMAERMGTKFPDSTEARIQLAASEFADGEIAPTAAFPYARAYLAERLGIGLPCIVGLNYKPGSQNRDGITDHFNLLCGIGEGGLLIGLNPGAEMHGAGYNAGFLEDPVNQVWRAVVPSGLKASMSMIVLPIL